MGEEMEEGEMEAGETEEVVEAVEVAEAVVDRILRIFQLDRIVYMMLIFTTIGSIK